MSEFSFTVDPAFNKQHNELGRDVRKLQISAVVFGLILLAIGFGANRLYRGAVGNLLFVGMIVMALIAFAIVFVIPKKTGNAQAMYDQFPLAPAIIAEVNPRSLTIMALVDRSVHPDNPDTGHQWALATRTVMNIPGVEKKVGARLPVVAVAGSRSPFHQDTWDEISPMPIGWATGDKDVIAAAMKAIPSNQWSRLDKNREKVTEVQQTKFNLLPL